MTELVWAGVWESTAGQIWHAVANEWLQPHEVSTAAELAADEPASTLGSWTRVATWRRDVLGELDERDGCPLSTPRWEDALTDDMHYTKGRPA